MNTMDRMVSDAAGCLASFWFLIAGAIALGIGYLIAKWIGVTVVLFLLLLWYLNTRTRTSRTRRQ